MHADDLCKFDALDKGIQMVKVAMKSFSKTGNGKAAQKISDDEEYKIILCFRYVPSLYDSITLLVG